MSHFSTLVISKQDQDWEAQLFPYMEDVGYGDEEMEFFENERGEIDPETGKRGWWVNPWAKWDWYELGGRFSGQLRASAGQGGDGSGKYDVARLGDCDFSPDPETVKAMEDFWDRVVEGKNAEDGVPFHLRPASWYRERYASREEFVLCESSFSTWAVVTPDGEWHQEGNMGWWGFGDESHDEAKEWSKGFVERFLSGSDPDLILRIVDCHV